MQPALAEEPAQPEEKGVDEQEKLGYQDIFSARAKLGKDNMTKIELDNVLLWTFIDIVLESFQYS